jgi:cation transport ATPase
MTLSGRGINLKAGDASLDQGSEHPLAEAIVRAARERHLALEAPDGFESSSGIGVRGTLGGAAPLHWAMLR